jgi:hypothetical protein
MPVVAIRVALYSVAACLGLSAAAAERVAGPLREPGPDGQTFVGYLPQASLAEQPFDRWPGLQARVLGRDSTSGRLAVQARFPSGWIATRLARSHCSVTARNCCP